MIKKSLALFLICVSVSFAQFLGPKISTQQTDYNFGEVESGKIVAHNYIITNTGDDNLTIKSVHASCGCTAAKPEKDQLAPGESTNIKVEFNSSGRKGPQEKIITVATNDTKTPELKLKLTGNVVVPGGDSNANIPVIFFSETDHNFGKVKEGKTAEYTFKFTNRGTAPLEIKDVRTSCGCTAALISSKKIDPGKEGTLKVELDTKNRSGKMSRTITISSNDVKEPNKILTIYADVEK